MYYKIGSNAPITFEIPEDLAEIGSGGVSAISNDGVAVGYFETYVPMEGFVRYPAIYHSSLGSNPIYVKDFLLSHGIETTNFYGAASNISKGGKYISGFGNGVAFMATGWAISLGDTFSLATQESSFSKVSVYPNPAKDVLNVNAKNITEVEIFNLVGQKVYAGKSASSITISHLDKGVYVVKVTADGKTQTTKFIKQ